MLALHGAKRRETRYPTIDDENDKEQSGAETVKIASRIDKTRPRFQLLVTAR
jgi:hypothetical protein